MGRRHFSYHHSTGHEHENPHVSLDTHPESSEAMATILHYLRARSWEQEVASKWLKVVDNETHQAYKTRYDEIHDAGELDILSQGSETCYMGSSLLTNMAVQHHKGIEDVKRGWVGTNNWEQYEGAFAIFHALGIKVPQRHRTTILSRSAVSAYSFSAIESGFHFSHVWYSKAALLDPNLAKKRSGEDEDDFSTPDKKSSDVSQNDGPACRSDRERIAPRRFPGMVSNVVGLEEEASETGSTEDEEILKEEDGVEEGEDSESGEGDDGGKDGGGEGGSEEGEKETGLTESHL